MFGARRGDIVKVRIGRGANGPERHTDRIGTPTAPKSHDRWSMGSLLPTTSKAPVRSDIEIGPHPICGSGRRDRLDIVGARERAADAVEDVREDGRGLPDGDVVASRPASEDTSRGSGVLRSYGGHQTDGMRRMADSWELQEAMIDGLAGTDGSDGNAILLTFKLEPTRDDLDALEAHLRATHETVMQAQAAWELTPA